MLAIALALPPLFAPGKRFDYSNTNTILLGKVIEQVSGTRRHRGAGTADPGPAQLGHTSMPGSTDPYPSPYAKDLLVHGRVLNTGQGLLKAENQIERLTSMPEPAEYGLVLPGTAWYCVAVGCVVGWFGHTGGLPGYNTSVFYDTGTDTTVVVLVNSDVPTGARTDSKTPQDNPKE